MPHWRPMMKTSPQITIVEETIRIPAWRSASPKKRKTRSEKTSPRIRPANLAISPNEPSQSLGMLSQPALFIDPLRRSPDHVDLGMGGQKRLREDVVEGEDAEERDHDRLVDGSAHAGRAARSGHSLVTADDRDDRPEHQAFED